MRQHQMDMDPSLLDQTMDSASTASNPGLTRRITRSVIMALKKQVVGVHSFRIHIYSQLPDVDPTSERAILNHYGRIPVEGRAITPYEREVSLIAEYDVAAGELQQIEIV